MFIPSIEQIYNTYHKWTMYFYKGIFPKQITNFDKVFEIEGRKEQLQKFQNFLKRNGSLVDWNIYIYAIARLTKIRFPLNLLGSLKGTRIYRDYINLTFNEEVEQQQIYDEIVRSIKNLNYTLKELNINFKQYFEMDNSLIPLSIKHLYSGYISPYFYSCFPGSFLNKTLITYLDDVYIEMFQQNKFDYINNVIVRKRSIMLRYENIRTLVAKVEKLIF